MLSLRLTSHDRTRKVFETRPMTAWQQGEFFRLARLKNGVFLPFAAFLV